MRRTVPLKTIHRISSTIKALHSRRPALGATETGKNLSLNVLYNSTLGLNNRLFKNSPTRFISKDKKRGSYLVHEKLYDLITQELMKEYEEDYS